MNQLVLASALAAIILPVTPALAEPHGNDRRAYASEYDRYGHYNQPRPLTQTDEVWRGPDGHYHCKRSNGTTGLVIGAVGGALVGRAIDRRGDRTLGTVLGAVGGGLLGREIDRRGSRCR